MTNHIFLISGAPGSGKSTLAKALSDRFEKFAYLEMDQFRKFVISGFVPPVPSTEDSETQALLAYKNASECAKNYFKEGYSVAIDEVASSPGTIKSMLQDKGLNTHLVSILLLPDLSTNLRRNKARKDKSFDVSDLEGFIQNFSAKMQTRQDEWDLVIDNSDLTVDGTVDKILQVLSSPG